jgi:hypothetical protein
VQNSEAGIFILLSKNNNMLFIDQRLTQQHANQILHATDSFDTACLAVCVLACMRA